MATTPTAGTKTPLLLIHGAWLSARSWENFADYFGTRGFTVSAPEWPRKEGDVEQLREDADELAGLGLDEIVDHYETLIRKLDQAPVLIGHSFGGLIVELLLDRGLGRAGVALSPAEGDPRAALLVAQGSGARPRASIEVARRRPADPRGVHLRLREHVHPRGGREGVRAVRRSGDRGDSLRGWLRKLPSASADRGSLQEWGTSAAADRRRRRGPHGPGVAREEAVQEYEDSPAKTDYVEFAGRPHLSMVGDGWEEVAAGIDSWLSGVLEASKAAEAPAGPPGD